VPLLFTILFIHSFCLIPGPKCGGRHCFLSYRLTMTVSYLRLADTVTYLLPCPSPFLHCLPPFLFFGESPAAKPTRGDSSVIWDGARAKIEPKNIKKTVYTMQPVAKPVVNPVRQPVGQQVVSCIQTSNRFSNRLYNRLLNCTAG